MQIVLTDVLTCPRCGPTFGLIVLADRLENRRVVEGRLGCANCRESYEIRGGVADLALPPLPESTEPSNIGSDAEAAIRLAALLGLAGARGLVLLGGSLATLAGAVVELVPEATVAALGPNVASLEEHGGVSRVLVSSVLPFRERSAVGIALAGAVADPWVEAAVGVIRPGARIVTEDVPNAAGRLRAAGLSVLLEEDAIVVATAPAAG